jgi:Family of unknown function (DUF6247)
MTAAASSTPPGGRRPETWVDATPAEVCAVLTPESAAEFDLQWREALSRAADTYDLTVVHACLEAWCRVARVTVAAGGHDGYRALRSTAATALEDRGSGTPGVPWREVRGDLGL